MGGRWSSNKQPPNATNEIVISDAPEESTGKRSRRSFEPVEEETHTSPKRWFCSYAMKKKDSYNDEGTICLEWCDALVSGHLIDVSRVKKIHLPETFKGCFFFLIIVTLD